MTKEEYKEYFERYDRQIKVLEHQNKCLTDALMRADLLAPKHFICQIAEPASEAITAAVEAERAKYRELVEAVDNLTSLIEDAESAGGFYIPETILNADAIYNGFKQLAGVNKPRMKHIKLARSGAQTLYWAQVRNHQGRLIWRYLVGTEDYSYRDAVKHFRVMLLRYGYALRPTQSSEYPYYYRADRDRALSARAFLVAIKKHHARKELP